MREMKDSGAYWLGFVPSDWSISKISTVYELRTTKVSDKDYSPLSVTMKGIVPQLETAAKTNAHDDRKLVKKGDFVINSRSDRRGSCGISEYDGSVSLINTVMKPRNTMNPHYYNWVFHTIQFADEFYKWGHGIVDDLWTTNWQDMKHIDIPVPSINEQEKIAVFLDTKCSEIDALYSNIEQQIATLEEYKKSVITEAVTKGLNPDVEMKDSGVEWIGDIPKEWMKSRIKYIASIFGRIGFRGYTTEDLVDEGEGAITLSPSNIINMKITYDKCSYISWDKYYESPEIAISNNDIIFVKTGSSYGKSAIVEDLPLEATINPQLIVFKQIKYDKSFFMYILQTEYIKYQVEQIVSGSTIPTMAQEKIKNFIIVLPPLLEQQKIVLFLDDKCSEIDALIKEKKEQLTTLEEYKKSLIYEYVTGKKEVPSNI